MAEPTRQTTIIPASHGWAVALFVAAGTDPASGETWPDYLSYEPIIAWEIERKEGLPRARRRPGEMCVSRGVLPITVSGAENYGCPQGIRRPDGHFDLVDLICETAAVALAELRRQHDEDEARRAGPRLVGDE